MKTPLLSSLAALLLSACGGGPALNAEPGALRFATFNAALNRPAQGQLAADLADRDHAQAKAVAEIIQRVRPDVLLLQEFDRDGEALLRFQAHYLAVPQGDQEPIVYPHRYMPAVNTGVPSGLDLDRDGETDGPGDALGFGRFPGQYGFVVLSRYPIDASGIRTFQHFKWRSLPDAQLPPGPDGEGAWYSPEAQAKLPLSSKSHVDVPIRTPQGVIHVLAAHPTPPVFDGPEDRNGRRNHDELRLLADYLGGQHDWLVDDAGEPGALAPEEAFVIMGDMNADPSDGDARGGAIHQVLGHPRVHQGVARGGLVPASAGGALNAKGRPSDRPPLKGDPSHHTAGWGLRVDYVLPSANLEVSSSGVFWPAPGQEGAALVQPKTVEGERRDPSSDHRMVWVDLTR